MVNTKLINTVAAFFSIFVYLLAIGLIVFIYKGDTRDIKKFGYDEEKAVVVNLNDILINSKVNQKKAIKKSKPKHKIIKVSSNHDKKSKSDSRDIVKKDIKDLFSTMRVKKNANEIEEKLKQDKARASRLKKIKAKDLFKSTSINTNKIKQELMKIKKVLKDKKDKVKGDKDDKYAAKITSIIMPMWQSTISTKDGLKATVLIKIDKNGRFIYKILNNSFNNLFDSKLKHFLDNLTKEKFPAYKNGKIFEAEFIFADKEEI